ncbi:MAG: type VII secretion protein EccCa [Actinomycetales bacterium]|jgi:S-DNA-T family DNA segregation ATPase FtsK/SpoIIIE|nr:type VII secretion protein EccCa [Actinomycetales bacterium]
MTATTQTYREGRIDPPPMPQGRMEIQPPPPLFVGESMASNLIMTAIPMVGSLASVIFVAMSNTGPRGMLMAGGFLVATLGFVGVSVWRARTGKTAQITSDRREYLNYLRTIRDVARTAGQQQRQALAWIHPSPTALAAIAEDRTRVWERRPEDGDFLLVRYAVGPQQLALDLVPPESDTIDKLDPVAASALHRLLNTHRVLQDLPTAVALPSFARIEVTGAEAHVRAQARAMLAQAALMHGPDQLVIAVLTTPAALPEWNWVKWLPHAHSRREFDAAGPRRLVCTDLDDLVSLLPADLTERPRFGGSSAASVAPHIVIVVDSVAVPPGHSVITEDGVQGVTILDLPDRWDEVGDESRLRLHLEPAGGGRVRATALVVRADPVRGYADQLSIASAEALARRLTPLYAGEGPVREDALTTTSELTDLLGIGDIRTVNLDQTWRSRPPRDRLRVPIGVGADGGSINLDIKESAQQGMGPHGLVIGATGSGKSEVLRTLVLGLALTHSPQILNFVLVDFKGGATFAGMADMPHVSAIITNLSEELTLVDRMQDALSGEMTRRQELLRASGNFGSLRDYEKARTSGERPDLEPLPSLLIVCDEFSELLSAKPEFVDLFVAIGRLGRSLGIHLLLSSQRLEEGRLRGLDSHLSYRIGLRTFSESESRSVIGVGDAYTLPAVPGLGFLKPDQSSLWRFKAAYVSGPPKRRAGAAGASAVSARREVLPFLPGLVTSRAEVEHEAAASAAALAAAAPETDSRSTFDIAVDRMAGRGPAAHQVWLAPLDVPDTFDALLPDLAPDPALGLVSQGWRHLGPLRFPIGTVDMPREQKREVLRCDLSGAAGHVAVVGAPRSGKSTLLRTIVTGIALTHSPREAQFYILDFGGGTFTGLRDLAHVAGVGTRAEPDVVRRIVAEVVGITDAREEFFRAHGIDTIETYRARRAAGEGPDDGYGDIFLVVDGWSTLRAEFDALEGELQVLAQRALTFGVHLLTSATRWMDYRTGIRDLLGTRFELRLGDAMDSEIDRKVVANIPMDRPGRGVTTTKYHFLGALPRIDGDGRPGTLGSGVAHLVAAVAAAWQGPTGPKLRLLPTRILADDVRSRAPRSDLVLLGVNEKALAPVGIDVAREPHLLIFGDGQSGKSNLLRTYMREVMRKYGPDQAQLFIVDYRRAHLGEFPDEWVSEYCTTADQTADVIEGVTEFLATRLPGPDVTPDQLRSRSWWTGREAFIIVDDYELVATSQGNPVASVVPLLAQAADIGMHVAVARRAGGAGRSYDPLVTALRDLAQPGVVLAGDPGEGALVGNVRAVPAAPGRGQLVTRAGTEVIQVSWSPSAHDTQG